MFRIYRKLLEAAKHYADVDDAGKNGRVVAVWAK